MGVVCLNFHQIFGCFLLIEVTKTPLICVIASGSIKPITNKLRY